jgi:hypothetical protein
VCRQDELSYEEIAKVLECSLSATKSLIHRGWETLNEKLKPYLQSGEWEWPRFNLGSFVLRPSVVGVHASACFPLRTA